MYINLNRLKKIALSAYLMLSLSLTSMLGQSDVVWSHTYGGEQDETFQDIFINSDKEAQVIGFGQSSAGTVKTGKGLYDMIICEMDQNGQLNWTSTIGGSDNDLGKTILIDQGKTYIGGLTYSTDLNQKLNLGSGDILFGNLDEETNALSQSTLLGGNKLDNIVGVQLQQDGSIILVANTNSSDLAQNGVGGGTDIYICRLLPDGTPLWENTIGSTGVDKAGDFKINRNGEIIIVGTTFSNNFLEFRKGIKDGFVLCLNSEGEQIWGKRFSNGNYSNFVACDLDRNGNILVTGVQGKINDANSGINGIYNEDIWVLQLDQTGAENWRNLFGGSDNDFATDIVASHDGGMLIVGHTESYDGLVNGNYGNRDAFALKLDASGNRLWSQKYGGSRDDLIEAVAQDKEGYYWLVGQTSSDNNDLSENNGGSDAWILKLEGERPVLQVDLGAPIEICEGESIEINAELSFCSCTYEWSDGAVGAKRTLTALESETITLTVTDEAGNSAIDDIEIIVNQMPNYTLIASPLSCANSQDGELSIILTEFDSELSYIWNNGSTESGLDDLAAGTYSLTVTDAKGCTQELSTELEAPTPLEVEAVSETATCHTSSGQIALNVTGGTGAYSYAWSDGNEEKDNQNLLPGEYTVTITDENSCTVIESFEIGNTDINIDLEFEILNNNCFEGAEGLIQILNSEDFASFSWNTNSETAEITDLSAGEYTLNYTTVDGCTGEQIFEISEPNLLEVSANANNNLCFDDNNGSIGLELRGGTPPYAYSWNTGVQLPFLTGLGAGEYSVTISDANGCSKIIEQEILSPAALAIDEIITIDESCADAKDGMITLMVSGGSGSYEFIWNTGDDGSSLESLNSGLYEVSITDGNGCNITSEVEIENNNTYPLVQVDQIDPSCHSGNDGYISFDAEQSEDALLYTWPDGSNDQERNDLASGTYEVTVSSAVGCSVVEEITLLEPAALDVELETKDVSCYAGNDAELEINVGGGTSPYTIGVMGGGSAATQVQGNASVIDNLQAGIYDVIVTDGNGCTQEVATTINEPDQILIEENINAISCFGADDAQLELNVVGGTSPYTIEINSENLSTQLQSDTALVDDLSAGIYNIDIIDNNGCAELISTTISEPEQITIEGIITDASCFGKADAAIEAIVSGGVGDIDYAWGIGSNSNTIEDINAADYQVVVTDENGCTQEQVFEVGQPEELSVENSFTQPSASNDDGSISLFISGGTAPYEVTWNDNIAQGTDLMNLSAGIYRYTVEDNNGCLILGSIALEVATSIHQISPFNGISLYPNPVDQHLQILADSNYRDVAITLYNALGQIVYTGFYPRLDNSGRIISAVDLASGMYHVHIANQDHQSSFKVVVSHP